MNQNDMKPMSYLCKVVGYQYTLCIKSTKMKDKTMIVVDITTNGEIVLPCEFVQIHLYPIPVVFAQRELCMDLVASFPENEGYKAHGNDWSLPVWVANVALLLAEHSAANTQWYQQRQQWEGGKLRARFFFLGGGQMSPVVSLFL